MNVFLKKYRPAMRRGWAVFTINLQNAFVYRSNVLNAVLLYAILVYIMCSLWQTIYGDGDIGGLNLTQIVWYLCVTEYVSFSSRSAVFRGIGDEVRSGDIAYSLTRPFNYAAYKLLCGLGESAYYCVVFGFVGVGLGFLMAGPLDGFNLAYLPLMLLSIVAGIVLNYVVFVALGLTALVFEENSGFYLIYSKLVFMLGMLIPVEFLPQWLQPIAKALPFSYVAWAPARLFVGFSWEFFFRVFPLQLMWIAVAGVCATAMYRAGFKRLQAQGG